MHKYRLNSYSRVAVHKQKQPQKTKVLTRLGQSPKSNITTLGKSIFIVVMLCIEANVTQNVLLSPLFPRSERSLQSLDSGASAIINVPGQTPDNTEFCSEESCGLESADIGL